MTTGSLKSLEVIASMVETQLDLQWALWDSVDTRIRLLLGFSAAVFLATLALLNRGRDFADASTYLLAVAISLLIVSTVVAGLAWLPREFDRPPKPSALRDNYLATHPVATKLAVLDTMIEAYNDNEKTIDEKLVAFRRAALSLSVAVLLIAIAVIVELFSASSNGTTAGTA